MKDKLAHICEVLVQESKKICNMMLLITQYQRNINMHHHLMEYDTVSLQKSKWYGCSLEPTSSRDVSSDGTCYNLCSSTPPP